MDQLRSHLLNRRSSTQMEEEAAAPRPPLSSDAGELERLVVLSDHGWINGGQAEMAIESALHVKARGIRVSFIAGAGPIDERLRDAGVDCTVVGDYDILTDPNRLRAASRGIWNGPAARAVSECIGRGDPRSTLVHIHGWAKALSPSIGPAVTRSGAAHVYTLHDYFLGCPNGGFYDYRANSICRKRALGLDCLTTRCDSRTDSHKAWRVARQSVMRNVGRMPEELREIIYLAPEQRSILGSYINADARWHFLPNPAAAGPGERIRVEDNKLFLFIGRMSPEKGAEVAAMAARLAGVAIAFCGDGRSKDIVRRVNPDAQLRGWLPKEELGHWMGKARALVFPSLWYEGYPLVVADALRAGLPVIVSDSCMAASSITDGVDGLHVPAGNVVAWADAMTRFKSDNFARALGSGAFSTGATLLGYDDYISRLLSIYGQALERHREKRNGWRLAR